MSNGRAVDNRTCVAKMNTTTFCIIIFFRSDRIEHSVTFDCNQKMHLFILKSKNYKGNSNRKTCNFHYNILTYLKFFIFNCYYKHDK